MHPRIFLTSHIFLYNLPREHRYKVLFMRRNPEEVVASQKAMLRRRGEADRMSDLQLMDSYVEQLRRLDAWIRKQENFLIRYFEYDDVVNEPAEAAGEIVRFLSLPLDVAAMIGSVDPSLYRNRGANESRLKRAGA